MKNLAIVFKKENFLKFYNLKNIIFLPMSMDTFLYCKENKIDFIDPKLYFNNNDHKNGQIFTEKQVKNISIKGKKRFFLEQNLKCNLRYVLNFLYLLKILVIKIKSKYKFNKIYISDSKLYFGREIFDLELLFKLLKIEENVVFLNKEKFSEKKNIYEYKYSTNLFKNKTFDFAFLVTGYNFRRLIVKLALSKKKLLIISLAKLSFIKKILFTFLNIKYLEIIQKNLIKSALNIHVKKTKELRLLKYLSEKLSFSIECLYQKKILIDELHSMNKINYVVVHNSSADSLSFIFSSKEHNCKIILISHGTVSGSKLSESKFYNNLISEALYSKYIDYSILQSRLAEKFKYNNKIKRLKIGNIIYANKMNKSKKFILYGVTSKNCNNIHFWGQELFFEFYANLKFLNLLAKEKKLRIIVKLHPNYADLIEDFNSHFKYLKFSNNDIDKLLKNAEMSLSFSSSIIEDSILSKVPVILFDSYNRYKHFSNAQTKDKKNFPIYYVNEKKDLYNKIKIIKDSDNIKFKNMVYSQNVNQSIEKFLKHF